MRTRILRRLIFPTRLALGDKGDPRSLQSAAIKCFLLKYILAADYEIVNETKRRLVAMKKL